MTAPLLGRETPRVFTPPLVTGAPGECGCGCALDAETSLGFSVADFAREIIGMPLRPWQRWCAIHALELLPDGRPRFRTVLILVARQNGKTHLLRVIALWWLFLRRRKLIIGTSTSLETASETWQMAVDLALEIPDLLDELPDDRSKGVRQTNGQQRLTTKDGCIYRVAPANRRGGRGSTVHNLIMDELREHKTWESWSAATKAMMAVDDAQNWCITNAGDDESIVLNSIQAKAMLSISAAQRNEPVQRPVGLFEYSAPDGCELDDRDGLCQANPSLGYGHSEDAVYDALQTDPPEVFRTEVLCQHVPALDSAVPAGAWISCADPVGNLNAARGRVALVVDISLDLRHVTVAAAALLKDGRVRTEIVSAWSGPNAVALAKNNLPKIVKAVNPRRFGWFPTCTKAGLESFLTKLTPPSHQQPITAGAIAEACGGYVMLAIGGEMVHGNDDLLNAHVAGARKMPSGDGFVFARRGVGHVDALYASVGAVALARAIPREVRAGEVLLAAG